jgi:PadR family transcriptional regulator
MLVTLMSRSRSDHVASRAPAGVAAVDDASAGAVEAEEDAAQVGGASAADDATADDATADDATAADGPASTETAASFVIASDHDASGIPIHRGWSPVGAHRWMEPFVLAFLASGASHGYAIVGELAELGITNGPVDVGQVYRTLRDLEQAGHVVSSWTTGTGPARRDYDLTEDGYAALDEWAAVMKERGRLIAEFDARYLEWTAGRRKRRTVSASGG